MVARSSGRRTAFLALAILAGLLIGWWWRQPGNVSRTRSLSPSSQGNSLLSLAGSDSTTSGKNSPGRRVGSAPATTRVVVPGFGTESPQIAPNEVSAHEPRITLADSLNAPGGTQAADFHTIQVVLEAWRSNFPHDGNPVGENVEITAALMGNNRLHLVLVSPDNRALNAQGELCDRWGTPIMFHQVSGEIMELRSAGPDGKFGTADDVTLLPH